MGYKGLKESRAKQEQLVRKDRKVSRAFKVNLGQKAILGMPGQRETREILESKVLLEKLAFKVNLARRGQRETRATKGILVLMVHRVNREYRDCLGLMGTRGLRVIKVPPETQAQREIRVTREMQATR